MNALLIDYYQNTYIICKIREKGGGPQKCAKRVKKGGGGVEKGPFLVKKQAYKLKKGSFLTFLGGVLYGILI